jgi:hypothetical protein
MCKIDYDAAMPLPVRQKWGMKYFFRPFGVQQLGIFSKTEVSDEVVVSFQKMIAENCTYADVYFNQGEHLFPLKKAKIENNNNFTLPLNRSYERIYKDFSKGTKRNIKKGQSNRWEVHEHGSPEQLVELFKNNKGGDLNLKPDFYKTMQRIMYAGIHGGWGKIWLAYSERNQPCAGFFMIEFQGRCIFLFSGNTEEGKSGGAMFYLINEYIILNSNKKELLDFEGSNNEGLARFYNGFGAKESNYQRLLYNNLPIPLRWLK